MSSVWAEAAVLMEDEFKISTVLGLNLGPSGNQVATPHGRKKRTFSEAVRDR